MTAYTATGNSAHRTLTAGTVDVITLDAAYPTVEVINRDATADLYFTIDRGQGAGNPTVTPAVLGDGCYYVGPKSVRVLPDDRPGTQGNAATTPTTVRVISASAIAYSVTGLTGN